MGKNKHAKRISPEHILAYRYCFVIERTENNNIKINNDIVKPPGSPCVISSNNERSKANNLKNGRNIETNITTAITNEICLVLKYGLSFFII